MKTIYAIFIALFVLGCSYLGQNQRGMDDEVVKEKQEELFDAAMQLLEESSKDPATYRNSRRSFEIALARYLQATEWKNGKILHLEKEGLTLLLPIQILESGDISQRTVPMLWDSVKMLWMPVGPMFKGEIVDLKWIPAKNSQQADILALFPDSLISLSWTDNTLVPNHTMVFDSAMLRPVRASFPMGLFLPSTPNEIQFLTTHLKATQLLFLPNLKHGNKREGFVAWPDEGAEMRWRYLEGTDILQNSGDIDVRYGIDPATTGIRSIRQLPGANMRALLDQAGFLVLTSNTAQNPIWISDRPWGNRIFLVDSSKIAVCDSRHSYVTVFERSNQNELQLRGQSPEFDGNVTAMTAVQNGVLINTVMYDSADVPWSQLHLISDKKQLWNMPTRNIEPEYHDYNSELVFLPGESHYLNGSDWLESLPQVVWMNVYETLFRRGQENILLPILVSSTDHDSSMTRWRFELKPGIRFADGTPLTAEDVLMSWQKNIEKGAKTTLNMRWLWKDILGIADFIEGSRKSIEGFHTIDKLHLEVRLTKPIPNFRHHLTSPIFGIKKTGTRWSLGTGPFKITEIQKDKSIFSISCERNKYYHQGMPPLQTLIFVFEIANLSDFLTNNRDAAASIRRIKDIEYFRNIPNFQVVCAPDEVIYFLALNPLSGALSDVDFRQRIVSSLSQEIAAKTITGAESYPANYLASRKGWGNPKAASADKYLGTSHQLTLGYCKEDPVSRQIAERLATKLSQMEIPHRAPVAFSADYFGQSRQNGNYDILVDYYVPSYKTDAYNLLQVCKRGYVLGKEISNQLDTLLSDPDKAYAMRIEREILERAILYPVVATKSYVVLPLALREVKIFGIEEIEFSKAWKPL